MVITEMTRNRNEKKGVWREKRPPLTFLVCVHVQAVLPDLVASLAGFD